MGGTSVTYDNDILIVTDNFLETGSLHNRQLQLLVKYCVAKNKTLTILSVSAPQKDKWHKGQYRHIGLGCVKHDDANFLARLNLSLSLKLLLMKLKAHRLVLIDAECYPLQFAINKWASRKKIPQIYWAHKVFPDNLGAENRTIKTDKKMKQFFKSMKLTICNNISVYKYLSHNGVDTRKLKVIASDTLNLTKDSRKTIKSASAEEHSHLKKDPIEQKFRILFSGEIREGASLRTVLNVAKAFQEKNPEIEFIFSGFGKGVSWLKQERERLSLNNIKLMPLQPAPSYLTFLETGDLHLAIQDKEASGISSFSSIQQSWAVHRPCVFVGDLKSENALAIRKSETGIVVGADEEHKLFKTILSYRMDPDKWFAAHEKTQEMDSKYTYRPLEEWQAVMSKAVAS
jgi:glycosyltransferase involved in cell wall biosynthesis